MAPSKDCCPGRGACSSRDCGGGLRCRRGGGLELLVQSKGGGTTMARVGAAAGGRAGGRSTSRSACVPFTPLSLP